MGYEAKILADSKSPHGIRLTTMQVTFPRIILAEFNTHRVFSRNSASSRAIPVEKMIKRVKEDPFIPVYWGKNQKGMQAEQELTEVEQRRAMAKWRGGADEAIRRVEELLELGVHKQITNRILEPWLWHTAIVSFTEWQNFFNLRCHKHAQPEIRKIAEMMRDLYFDSQPQDVDIGERHLPLVRSVDMEQLIAEGYKGHELGRISCARCARVSYLTHEGTRSPTEDLSMADRLQKSGHMSPFEHAARPMTGPEFDHYTRWEITLSNGEIMHTRFDPDELALGDLKIRTRRQVAFCGNFNGWIQHRKELRGEAVFQPEVTA